MNRHAEDNEDTDKTFPRGGTTCDAYNVSEINNTGDVIYHNIYMLWGAEAGQEGQGSLELM